MLQRLPIALAQAKAGNNSENLLNEIRQSVYSLYQSKQITKKYIIMWLILYNKTVLNYIKKMNTIFINSENSKTSKAHVIILNLTNELDLRTGETGWPFNFGY